MSYRLSRRVLGQSPLLRHGRREPLRPVRACSPEQEGEDGEAACASRGRITVGDSSGGECRAESERLRVTCGPLQSSRFSGDPQSSAVVIDTGGHGGDGNDVIEGDGDGGRDRLIGTNGIDSLDGGAGRDFCNGRLPNPGPRGRNRDRNRDRACALRGLAERTLM